ncbi:hypothetical protein ACFWBN_22765 [Streptomyces sp. NPDC059989]|uniref:hypothetical protein n=1 Tax=Streptomyces sp. NPDC059989 TaxID=3347026 RepID=UPI00368D0DFE
MDSFLSGLGSKLAEKWLTVLVLPGLLFVLCVLSGIALRDAGALDLRELGDQASAAATRLRKDGAYVLVAVVTAALAATGAALLVQALGSLVGRFWLGRWPEAAAGRLIRWRRDRWSDADEEVAAALAEGRSEEVDTLTGRRNRMALSRPARPTWIGDRTHGVDVRVWHAYGLDLGSAWPRLWILADDSTRADITAARTAYDRAAALTGWGLLYLAVGLVWWPAAPAGAVAALTGWRRGRTAAATFADLAEATVDLHIRALAQQLGALAPEAALTRDTGLRITALLRKGT